MNDDFFKQLYLEWLSEPVAGPHGARCRARKIEAWKNFQPVLPHRHAIDLQYATNGCLADGRYVWLWADQHFGHKNIIDFSNRPYPNLELMHECMILNHNEIVQPQDVCIWVGDISFLKADATNEILHQLNGYKILILGNHDLQGSKVKKLHVNEIHLMKVIQVPIKDKMYDLVLTHYPMHNLPKKNVINIHGHEHVSFLYSASSAQHINVNCELHGYKPISMQSVIDLINKRVDNEQL